MITLNAKDLRRLATCNSDLLAWNGEQTIEQHFMNVLPQLIDSQIFVYQSFDFRTGTNQLLEKGEMPDHQRFEDAFFAHIHEHPLIRAARESGNIPAMRISDLMPQEEFERTGLYNEFYRHVGIASQLAISLPARPGDVIGLVYSRKQDFTERERQLLDAVCMHVLHMYRQAKRFDFLMQRLRLAHAMLETLEDGVIAR